VVEGVSDPSLRMNIMNHLNANRRKGAVQIPSLENLPPLEKGNDYLEGKMGLAIIASPASGVVPIRDLANQKSNTESGGRICENGR